MVEPELKEGDEDLDGSNDAFLPETHHLVMQQDGKAGQAGDEIRAVREELQKDEHENVVEPVGHTQAHSLTPGGIGPVPVRLEADDVVPEKKEHVDDREAERVGDRIPPSKAMGEEPKQAGIDPDAQDPTDQKPKQTCKKGLREFQWNGALS